MIRGIDVSNHQTTFPTTGYDFCIIKATEGRTFTDPKQGQHAARARAAGMVVGFYHFLWPGNIAAQARYFVDKCASIPGDILACDWEHTSSNTSATSAEKDAFLREVKRLRPDHRVILYCNTDFWLNRDTSSYAADGLWIAHYGIGAGKPGIRAPWLIHQYTSSPLDINVARFDSRADMRAWATEEDDVALTTEQARQLKELHALLTPYAGWDYKSKNETRDAFNYLRTAALDVAKLGGQIATQTAAIAELTRTVGVLASGLGDLDPAAVVAELRTALESIDIRIDA